MVVFFDIDGTLVDDATQIIPASAIEAVKTLRRNGHTPVVNTGRPYGHIDPRVREMDFSGWICGCGMEVMLGGQWLYRHSPSPELCAYVRQCVKECDMRVLYEGHTEIFTDGVYSSDPLSVREARRMAEKGFSVRPLEDPPRFMKFVTQDGPHSQRQRFLELMEPHFTCIIRAGTMIEFVTKGSSKAGGMAAVLQALGTSPEDTLAIGDSTNDLPMFAAAAHTAAMGGGAPALLAQAEFVTGAVLEDGIQTALSHFGLL